MIIVPPNTDSQPLGSPVDAHRIVFDSATGRTIQILGAD